MTANDKQNGLSAETVEAMAAVDRKATPEPVAEAEGVKLLPCPFCGGTDLIAEGDDKAVGVRCKQCEAWGPNHYMTGRDWNRRTAPAMSAPAGDGKVEKIEWRKVNEEPFEYAIQVTPHGDSFVALWDGTKLRRRAQPPQPTGDVGELVDATIGDWLKQNPDLHTELTSDEIAGLKVRLVRAFNSRLAASEQARDDLVFCVMRGSHREARNLARQRFVELNPDERNQAERLSKDSDLISRAEAAEARVAELEAEIAKAKTP